MTTLQEFLREAASQPFAYGEWDCGMTLARWVKARTGRDPAVPLRDRYRTRLGWLRLARRAGGLAALVGRHVEDVGLNRTDDPQEGDVGVVDVSGIGETAAIRTRRGWAVKVTDGIAIVSAKTVAAWSMPQDAR